MHKSAEIGYAPKGLLLNNDSTIIANEALKPFNVTSTSAPSGKRLLATGWVGPSDFQKVKIVKQ
jgi:hypothetical protein